MKKSGFTFVELLIAVVIGAFVTVTAAAAMRGIVSGRKTHQDLTDLSDEMRYACRLIQEDLNNIYRSDDFSKAKFEVFSLDAGDGIVGQSLLFYTVSRKKARLLEKEGDVYEVQYFLKGDLETDHVYLMRRYCPVVPGVPISQDVQPGGILSPAAENITGLQIRCYDGSKWTDEWNIDRGQFPQLIEIGLLAKETDGRKSIVRSIFINIARLKSNRPETELKDQAEDYDSYMNKDFSNPQTEGAPE